MTSELDLPWPVIALYVFLIFAPMSTRAEDSVNDKKTYGNWQVRQNQRYCRQVLYCKYREANCTQVTTVNTWTCNRINTEIMEKGCVMRVCTTELKMVCAAKSPGPDYQQTSSDSCPWGQQCYVKVAPQTTTPVLVRSSPLTVTSGSSTTSSAVSTASPWAGPNVTPTSTAQSGAAPSTTSVPVGTVAPAPAATTAVVPGATTTPSETASPVTTQQVLSANTVTASSLSTTAVSVATTNQDQIAESTTAMTDG